MTPAEHYAQAEGILSPLADGWQPTSDSQAAATAVVAIAHLVAAIAGELGVPTGTVHLGPAAAVAAQPSGQSPAG